MPVKTNRQEGKALNRDVIARRRGSPAGNENIAVNIGNIASILKHSINHLFPGNYHDIVVIVGVFTEYGMHDYVCFKLFFTPQKVTGSQLEVSCWLTFGYRVTFLAMYL